jgi:hypothetical protein
MSSQPAIYLENVEDNEGTDDDKTLAEVIKGDKMKTSQEVASSPNGVLLPSHPKKSRVTARKRRASTLLGGDEETPR